MKTETAQVKLPKTLYDKLVARKHPGQTVAGVVQELLNQVEEKKDVNR